MIRNLICLIFAISIASTAFPQDPFIRFSKRYLDYNTQNRGEHLFEIGQIPQGYLGLSAKRTSPGAFDEQTVTLLDTLGEHLRVFVVDSILSQDYIYLTEDSSLLLYGASLVWDSVWQIRPSVLKTDLFGNVEWYNRFSLFRQDLFSRGIQLSNQDFILIGDASGTYQQNDGRISLLCTDRNGQTKWQKFVGKNFRNYNPDGIQQWTDTSFLIVALGQYGVLDTMRTGWCHDATNLSYGYYLAEIDFDGNVIKDKCLYQHWHEWDASQVFAKLSGQRFVMSFVEPGPPNTKCFVYHAIAFDQDFNRVWTTPIPRDVIFGYGCKSDIRDNVIIGFDSAWSPSLTYPDGTQAIENGYQLMYLNGNTGVPIWHKAFMGYGVNIGWQPAIVNEFEPTLDGGFLIAAVYNDFVGSPINEKWFLKIDSLGCLIPGCSSYWLAPIPTETVEVTDAVRFEINPNPVADDIRYVLDSKITSGHFVISEINGASQIVYPIRGNEGIIGLQSLVAGTYLIAVYDLEHRLQVVKKVVKI
jgi:hypothetical protein